MNWELLERYGPRMLDGLSITVLLVGTSVIIGGILAFPIALARLSSKRWLARTAYWYIYAFRGTPLIAQVFLVYYGAGQFRPFLQEIGLWWFFREALYCAIFTFAIHTAAYQAEILRGAIQSVPVGQTEAAQSMGIPRWPTFFKVILPQAYIIALRPLGNELILMIKASSIASIITVYDVMGVTRLAFSRSFDFEVYIWAAIIYLTIVETIRRVWDRLEHRLTRHLRPAQG